MRPSSGRRSSSTCSARSSPTRSRRRAPGALGLPRRVRRPGRRRRARVPARPRPGHGLRGPVVPPAARRSTAASAMRSSGAPATTPTSRRRSSRSTSTRRATTSAPGATPSSPASGPRRASRTSSPRSCSSARSPPPSTSTTRGGGAGARLRGARRRLRAVRSLRPSGGRLRRARRPLVADDPIAETRMIAQDRRWSSSGRAATTRRSLRTTTGSRTRIGSTARTRRASRSRSAIGQAGIRYRQMRYEESVAAARDAIAHAERGREPAAARARLLHPGRRLHRSRQLDGLPYLERAPRSTRSCDDFRGPGHRAQQSRHPRVLRGPLGRGAASSTGRAVPRRSASATSSAPRSR